MSRGFATSGRGHGARQLLVVAALTFALVCAALWMGWPGARDGGSAASQDRREVTRRLLGDALVESQRTLGAMRAGNYGLAEEHARTTNERLTRVMAELAPAER